MTLSLRGLSLSLVISDGSPTVWLWTLRGVALRAVAGCDRVQWVA